MVGVARCAGTNTAVHLAHRRPTGATIGAAETTYPHSA